jgi:dTDP-4-dehydrorhamnose reductase
LRGTPIRILLTGSNGQIGWELRRALAALGEVVATDRTTLDLADSDAIRRTIRTERPDLIVNAAAYTQVDAAETEQGLAMKINGVAPGVIAEEAKRSHCALVHYSTDYVFSGSSERPYLEDDEPDPINVYGTTKLAGEKAIRAVGAPHLILRTSWVFDARGKNFLNSILRLARERDELRIVNDQIGTPTSSRAVADATAEILKRKATRSGGVVDEISEAGGIYHLCCEDHTTWFGFAEEILTQHARGVAENRAQPLRAPRLIPISSAEYPTPAKRPRYSVLSPQTIADVFGLVIPSWRHQLDLVMQGLRTGKA